MAPPFHGSASSARSTAAAARADADVTAGRAKRRPGTGKNRPSSCGGARAFALRSFVFYFRIYSIARCPHCATRRARPTVTSHGASASFPSPSSFSSLPRIPAPRPLFAPSHLNFFVIHASSPMHPASDGGSVGIDGDDEVRCGALVRHTLRAEPEYARRALMALLLPFVVVPLRVRLVFPSFSSLFFSYRSAFLSVMPVGVPTSAIRPVFPPWQGYTALWKCASASSEATRREDRGAARNAARASWAAGARRRGPSFPFPSVLKHVFGAVPVLFRSFPSSHHPIIPFALASYILSLLLALYHSTLQYDTVPLLPSVLRGMHDGEGEGAALRIRVLTLYGRFPVYALGDPGEGGDMQEGEDDELGNDADRLQEEDHPLIDTAQRSQRISRSSSHPHPRHARSRSLRRSRSTARSPRPTRSSSAHAPPPRPSACHPRSSSARPSSRAYPASSSSPRSASFSRSPRSPRVSSPPPSPAAPPPSMSQTPQAHPRALSPGRSSGRSRLLPAPPARLLVFARVQAGGRTRAPPFLARDRREWGGGGWWAGGGTGPQPVGSPQEAILEQEREAGGALRSVAATPAPPPADAATRGRRLRRCDERDFCAVDGAVTSGAEMHDGADGGERWAAPGCVWGTLRGFPFCARGLRRASLIWQPQHLAGGGGAAGNRGGGKKGEEGREERAPPGRIGRVYDLGGFGGLGQGLCWYVSLATRIVILPLATSLPIPLHVARRALPAPGCISYSRCRTSAFSLRHRPISSVPSEPHDTALVTAPGGAFPPGALERGAPGVICASRMRGDGAGNGSLEAQSGYAGGEGGYGAAFGAGGSEAGRGRGNEDVYVYETVGEGGRVREGAHAEGCPGCARAEGRGMRAGGDAERQEELSSSGRRSDASYESQWPAGAASASSHAASSLPSSSQGPSPSPQTPAPSYEHSPSSQALTSPEGATSTPQDTTSAASQSWPEWDAPTDPRHGMGWHQYEYAWRVRPWDGLVMRPRDCTLGLATYFIEGHLVGRNTVEGSEE
ncbi:hypothetical protein B0H15DRAFT_1027643 [Mycena belliarum]|uniref:Uncharacterized protein n=1 Tax=Mycena belliarum TaxID=1033014 RepID=A0AAD6TPR4_9AGAR|nr:hypothetical protein B0H15DRAFT_1027643 [Mycena belliae]